MGPPYAKGPMPAGASALAAGPVGAAMQLFPSTMSKIERRHHMVANDGQRGKFHIGTNRKPVNRFGRTIADHFALSKAFR